MATTHNLGFPRIGAKRELKFAQEAYWKGESSRDALIAVGAALRTRHWHDQAAFDLVPVGDFAFYDQILDMSFPWATCRSGCGTSMATSWTTISAWRAAGRPRAPTTMPPAAAVSPPVR